MRKESEHSGIVVYWETFDLLDELEPVEAKEMLYAIHMYAKEGIEPDFDHNRVMRITWKVIKADIDRSVEKYEQTRNARSAAGKASAEKRTNATNANKTQQSSTNANKDQQIQQYGTGTVYRTGTGTGIGTVSEREREKEREKAAPTLEEVRDYCAQRGSNVDPERFVAVNAAKGWKIGNTPVEDWKALLQAWEKSQHKPQRDGPQEPEHQHVVTMADVDKLRRMQKKISQGAASG